MNTKAITIIERLGGIKAVAQICEIRPPSVHQWKTDGIPQAREMYLRLLRPDVFADFPKESEAA